MVGVRKGRGRERAIDDLMVWKRVGDGLAGGTAIVFMGRMFEKGAEMYFC